MAGGIVTLTSLSKPVLNYSLDRLNIFKLQVKMVPTYSIQTQSSASGVLEVNWSFQFLLITEYERN